MCWYPSPCQLRRTAPSAPPATSCLPSRANYPSFRPPPAPAPAAPAPPPPRRTPPLAPCRRCGSRPAGWRPRRTTGGRGTPPRRCRRAGPPSGRWGGGSAQRGRRASARVAGLRVDLTALQNTPTLPSVVCTQRVRLRGLFDAELSPLGTGPSAGTAASSAPRPQKAS